MFSIWLIYLITQNFSFCSLTTYQFSHGVNWTNFTKNTQLREILRVLDQFSKIEILVQLFGKKLTVYWYLAIPLIAISVCFALLPPPKSFNFSSRTINKLFILLDFVFQLIANRTLGSTDPINITSKLNRSIRCFFPPSAIA